MAKKIGRNDTCDCGSGKKYKHCCLLNPKPQKSLYEKLMTEETQVFARVISKEGESASIQISQASVTKNGVTKVLLDEELTISTNKVPGDNTEMATALLTIPTNQILAAKVYTSGNAGVTNQKDYFDLEIHNNPKKMSIKSPKGLFASIHISQQGQPSFKYLSILFGVAGQKEFKNSIGRKNRSDIAIFPDGNGKFIRLSDLKGDFDESWKIETILNYDPAGKKIYPSQLIILSEKYSEKLILNFSFNPDTNKVILENGIFK